MKQRGFKTEVTGTPESNRKIVLEVSNSIHDMPCIQVEKPSLELRNLIRRAILENRLSQEAYQLHNEAGAFLQSDHEDYILVEFWKPNYQGFIDYLNKKIKEELNSFTQ
jgi:hypothetical protein